MSYGWKPYVSAAERRKKAERAIARSRSKAGQAFAPVPASRGAIARTFWGKAWCSNLEHYSDFANRLPRGRTYLRNGSVIDLNIAAGAVTAQVMGSSLYQVTINIAEVPKAHWRALGSECAGSIDSLVELLQGRLSEGVMERICRPHSGLFPSPKEIAFNCSCPDWAAMCKHVAAVFYGVGARLDQQPELLFALRKVDAKDLVARAGAGIALAQKAPAAGKVLDPSSLGDIFGIEMAAEVVPDVPATATRAVSAKKKASALKNKTVKRKAAKGVPKRAASKPKPKPKPKR